MRTYTDEELRERGWRPWKATFTDWWQRTDAGKDATCHQRWAVEEIERIRDATWNAAIEAAASLFDLFVSVLRDNEQHVCAHRVEAQIKTIRQLRRPE